MKSLKGRFLIIIAITLVVPALLTLVFTYLGTRKTMSMMIETDARLGLQAWPEEFAALRKQRLSFVEELITNTHLYVHQFRSQNKNEKIQFRRELENKLADYLSANSKTFERVVWIDGNGSVVIQFQIARNYLAATGRPLKIQRQGFGNEFQNLKSIAAEWTKNDNFIGATQIIDNGFTQTIGVPIRGPRLNEDCPDNFGMLFLDIRLNGLLADAARRSGPIFSQAVPMVFDDDGTILYHRDPEYVSQKLARHYPDVAAAMLARKTSVDTQHKNRDWRVFTRQYSGQWYFALLLRETKFIRRLEPLYWINLLIMVLGGMWAISLLGLSFRKLAKSIGELAAGAQAIATGDLDKRVAIDRTEELGVLGRSFNNMADSLKNLIHERAEKEKLRDLNQLKDAFISNVSHELREPLEHIDLGVENLKRGGLGLLNEQQQSYLIRVQQNTKRLIRMISELLDVARIESGSITLHRAPCSMEEIVNEVIDETRPIWQKKSLRVHGEGESANGHIIADRDMLKQVISNLLDNAIKFTNENGEISISSKRGNGSIELVVADSGIGIAEEHLQHIFDRFYQTPSSASKNGSGNRRKYGLGLGLNIVKTLVEAHGGEIRAESKIGEGTSMKVFLPVE